MPYGTVQVDKVQGSINSFSADSSFFRNRIINGAMVIDQRNAGGVVTYGSGGTTADNYLSYNLDRWYAQSYQSTAGNGGTFTIQRNAGSVTPPVGFSNYLGATVTFAQASPAVSSLYQIQTRIEGFNISDLAWGTANARAVTISFWVYSSLTGQYPLYLNNNNDIGYTTTYTISSANTWEYKTVTIPGPTSGTWNTTNGEGVRVQFTLAASSDRVASTLNSWTASGANSGASGSVNWMGTLNNRFFLTGVQLEVGSTATSFDYRPYGTELALCQRYYQASIRSGTTLMIGAGGVAGGNGSGLDIITPLVVTMRTSPTVSVPTVTNGYFAYTSSGTTTLTNSGSGVSSSPTMVALRFGGFASVAAWSYVESRQDGAGFTASAEL